jgi:hypothetical protein
MFALDEDRPSPHFDLVLAQWRVAGATTDLLEIDIAAKIYLLNGGRLVDLWLKASQKGNGDCGDNQYSTHNYPEYLALGTGEEDEAQEPNNYRDDVSNDFHAILRLISCASIALSRRSHSN